MKKSLMLLGNVLIILVIMAFIMLYVSSEQQKNARFPNRSV